METNNTNTNNNQVAKTILEQVGGRQFVAMTGAKNLVGSQDSLSFHLPTGTTKNKANRVSIELDSNDTYTVKFVSLRGTSFKMVSQHTDVYAEDLRGLLERETGLATSLSKRYAA